MKLKNYNWVLDGLAALVLLVGAVLIFMNMEDVAQLVVRLTGLGILFFTIIRLRPILKSRNEKDYVLVMFAEMLIGLIAGIVMLFFPQTVIPSDGERAVIFSFSRLSGAFLFVRGVTHFWTTSKRYELHDIISFIVHIVFLSFGFLFLANNNLSESNIVVVILILAFFLSGYFGFRTYKGYNHYRTLKTNALKVNDYLEKKEEVNTINIDPQHIEEKINPKKIEEPQEERPGINVN